MTQTVKHIVSYYRLTHQVSSNLITIIIYIIVCIKLLLNNNTLTGSQSGQQSSDVNVFQAFGVAEQRPADKQRYVRKL